MPLADAPSSADVVRASHEHKVDNPECATNANCQALPHTSNVICHHDATCMPICEPHWGNCNQDSRDGCEASITHCLYCDGDPRISEENTPNVVFLPGDDKAGPGTISSRAVHAALTRGRPALQRCYEQVLATTPGAGGTITYQLTMSAAGCIAAKQTKTDVLSDELGACAAKFLEQVRLSTAPEGGAVVWSWELVLSAPGPSDVQR